MECTSHVSARSVLLIMSGRATVLVRGQSAMAPQYLRSHRSLVFIRASLVLHSTFDIRHDFVDPQDHLPTTGVRIVLEVGEWVSMSSSRLSSDFTL